ncbi:MAG: hypothetical protein JWM07_597 [Candidatus Saccharibacteria bacterium]|nr:hypothetical protein [Candidatus Saccharibacteria bacterium]
MVDMSQYGAIIVFFGTAIGVSLLGMSMLIGSRRGIQPAAGAALSVAAFSIAFVALAFYLSLPK